MNGGLIAIAIFAFIVGIIIFLWQESEEEDLVDWGLGEYKSHERAILEAIMMWLFGLGLLIIGIYM
jgi:hypothetical protein